MHEILRWFTGGPDHTYMRLSHCLDGDHLWIAITVLLDAAVAAGYVRIAVHWWQNQRHLPAKMPARTALGNMRNIFVFCGICGYAFIPIKMLWPAWRLYDMFLCVLVYFTWKYAWNAKDLKVVYTELGRSRKLQDDLDQSREESRRKSSFLNALSHDLRTPLNGLMLQANFAELSLSSGDSQQVEGALRAIKHCTRVTSDLLDSLLEYAKVDWSDVANNFTTFSLNDCLTELMARFSPAVEQKSLSFKLGAVELQQIRTDRVKLERIISNLLSNAIKFTDRGGIAIDVQRAGSTDDSAVEIHISDTGIGIEPSVREHLFEEFFQGHNHERDPRKGFGLGLAIARRLASQLGGDIQLESAMGRGSRFSLVLPGVVVNQSTGDGQPNSRAVALVE